MSENDSMINLTVRSKIKIAVVRGKPLQGEDPFQYRGYKFNDFIKKEIEKMKFFEISASRTKNEF